MLGGKAKYQTLHKVDLSGSSWPEVPPYVPVAPCTHLPNNTHHTMVTVQVPTSCWAGHPSTSRTALCESSPNPQGPGINLTQCLASVCWVGGERVIARRQEETDGEKESVWNDRGSEDRRGKWDKGVIKGKGIFRKEGRMKGRKGGGEK